MVDRVRPLKLENPGSGGTQTDLYPTAANPNQDHLDVRGIVIQGDSSNDEVVRVSRDSSDRMTMEDTEVSAVTLTALRVHASRHNDGGGDELTVQLLGSGALEADQIIVSDGEGGWNTADAPSPSFGAWYKDEQEDGEIGTTSGTWQDALELTFPSDLEEGDYVILCAAIVRGSSSSTQVDVRLVFDTTELCSITLQATGTAAQVPLSGSHVQKSISGSHSYKIQYRQGGGAGTAYIKNRLAIAFRVA